MNFEDPSLSCLVVGLALVIMSAGVLWARFRRGALLTATGGLHANMLVFFGLGLVAYSTGENAAERVPAPFINAAISKVGPYLLIGYGAVALAEMWHARRRSAQVFDDRPVLNVEMPRLTLAVLCLAVAGYIGSTTIEASSGVGTVLPILKTFLYPGLVMSIVMGTRRKAASLFLACAFVAIVVIFAIWSPWRSEIVLTLVAVSLALILRMPRYPIKLGLLMMLCFFILLPFAHEKKIQYHEVTYEPLQVFGETLAIPLESRLAFVRDFWAIRLNGAREVGYVVDGLEAERLDLRGGLTYWEALQQLIPRVMWPGKPAFNETTNYFIARQLQLVSWEDFDTSWGISIYAEAVWNFGVWSLMIFVPLAFWLATKTDDIVERQLRRPIAIWLIRADYFFQFLGIVGLVNATTYILWSFVIVKVLDAWLGAVERQGVLAISGKAAIHT